MYCIFIGPMSDHWVALSVIKSLMLGDFINVSVANKNAYLKAVNVTAHVENDVLESFGHTLVPADKRIVKI